MLKFYNTFTRKKEIFKPLHDKKVGLYTCGPTVYNYAHIGNLRTYIFEDILARTLEYDGYQVKHVMNITDVGHLTSDADTGEDKIEKEAKKERKSVWQIADFYTKAFFGDLQKLNIEKPTIIVKATDTISDQIKIIQKLIEKKYAYETKSAIYFDVSRFKNYGKLSGQPLKEKITAARKEVVVDLEKRNSADFALWFKLAGRFKNHIMHWPSPWGQGFPGWHIECSAISTKHLGQPFDIHTGGVDHIGTHHTNEIAQSEAAFGKLLAKFWLHGEFLLIDKDKMAKSEDNFITLKDIIDRGINPLAFRYLCLQTHYRSKLNFSWKSLEAAQSSLWKIDDSIHTIWPRKENIKDVNRVKLSPGSDTLLKEFKTAVDDDLNTPKALATLHKTLDSSMISSGEKARLISEFNKILAIIISSPKPLEITAEIKGLVAQREKYRASKQFVKADRLRKEIERLGYVIQDTPHGPKTSPTRHRS